MRLVSLVQVRNGHEQVGSSIPQLSLEGRILLWRIAVEFIDWVLDLCTTEILFQESPILGGKFVPLNTVDPE